MTTDETVDLLTLIQSYDRRTVGRTDVAAWHLAIGDLDYADSQDAVIAYYRESREWIMPADIRRRVKEVRAERLRLNPVPAPPPELLDDPAAYRRALRESAQAIASGQDGARVIGSAS